MRQRIAEAALLPCVWMKGIAFHVCIAKASTETSNLPNAAGKLP